VLWVHASDHYLEVATPSTKAFVRARMRDAVARLRDRDGLQIHRSWWVARDAVRQIRRDGRDHIVILHHGEEVPVGRSRVRALRARGWI
jgi:DNA-binding LytR/AlgR family response regulator